MTLKNAAWFVLSATVLFLIFSAYKEHRSHATSDWGGLYGRRIDEHPAPVTQSQPEVVSETAGQPADGGVLQRGRGDVLLEVPAADTAATQAAAPPVVPAARPIRVRRNGDRVVITGGSDGVRTEVQPAATEPPAPQVPADATTTEPPPSR
jgi:hypothetical protein